ncbi:hypothetical protein V6N11_022240 [Hibiscus sabdariffa]|uniref:RNase H type-1 domain-containing protein n=1 Tax=Hibiscus sabdariffa TaxID=183260 RepID=A0ABR2TJJ7_9ROSI
MVVLRIGFCRHQKLLKSVVISLFDPSFKRAGIAAVFRDCSRNIVGGTNECVMAASACTTEAIACRLGVFAALDKCFNQVIVELDNIYLIQRLNGNARSCWETTIVKRDLLSVVASVSSCSFSYIRRDCNKFVDWVA